MSDRVVVTGLGVVSPIGCGHAEFAAGLAEKRDGLRPISLFDPDSLLDPPGSQGPRSGRFPSRLAGEASFDAAALLGPRGLRLFDRATRFALGAAKLALDDAGLEPRDDLRHELGVVLGSTAGSLASRTDFYLEAVRGGPRALNPALFPNTVVNSPSSQVAIRFGLMGQSTTISTGVTSSLEALDYAASAIRLGRARAILAGGVEELSPIALAVARELGLLAPGRDGAPEVSAPFDRRRNGAVLGEGAAILVLESLDHARRRGARVLAEYRGGAATTDLRAHQRFSVRAEGAARAIREALRRGRVDAGDVDLVSSGASSTLLGDAAEARALRRVLGRAPLASAIKSQTGESWSASGALQAALAVVALARGLAPAVRNLESLDPRCPVEPVAREARPLRPRAVLVTSVGPEQRSAACVLAPAEERP